MAKKPKILFIYDHPQPKRWMDGLYAALNILSEDFDIERMNLRKEGKGGSLTGYDFILGWGAFGSGPDLYIKDDWQSDSAKRGLCIGGNATQPEGTDAYDVLFYETKWYRPQIEFHPNIVHAFGVNTDIFSPATMAMPVVWDYIGVGALADWKRWEKMSELTGNRLVIGEYQLGNEEESSRIALELIKSGVMVSNTVHPFDLVNLYGWSRTLYMPSTVNGGGERSVLEALACGLDVKIEDDNPKLQELLDTGPIWDHHYYAKQLKRGIMSVL